VDGRAVGAAVVGADAPRGGGAIAKVAFTSEDRVRDVISNFQCRWVQLALSWYKGGRPPKFTLAQRREIK